MFGRAWRITKCRGRLPFSMSFRAASPARSSVKTSRLWSTMGERRPVLRAGLELANAANGVRPFGRDGYPTIPAFFLGWPTSEMAPLYMAGSMLGAVWRWLRGDYATRGGRIALLLKVITW